MPSLKLSMESVRLSDHGVTPALNQQETDRVPEEQGQDEKNVTQYLNPDLIKSGEVIRGAGRETREEDGDEKRARTSQGSSSSTAASARVPVLLNRDSPIDYVYLTFDTVLPSPNVSAGTGSAATGPEAIPDSPDLSRYIDPLRWPRARKNVMVAISCVATMLTAYTAGAYSPPVDIIARELSTTHEVALLGVTTFCLGFAYAPMILAPLSEINGRYPVFAVAGVFFTAFQAVCGAVTTVSGMLIARFIKGASASVFSTMVGGVISDLYDKEARNTPMALFSGAVFLGTGLGPLISSIIVEESSPGSETWKWVFWHQAIADFILTIAVVTLFRESRGSVILSKKAMALNKWYEELEDRGFIGVWARDDMSELPHPEQPAAQSPEHYEKQVAGSTDGLKLQRIRWKTKEDEERGPIMTIISTSLTRPFHFLFTEPIVFFFSLWVAFAWAVLYLTFASVPLVFRRQYDFSIKQSGYVFGSMIVGSFIATVFGLLQDTALKHPNWQGTPATPGSDKGVKAIEPSTHGFWVFIRRRFPAESPESRLYFTCFASALLPVGLYLFGFCAQPSIHWIVPTIAIGVATTGIYYVYLATFNYLADTYQTYASSALAAQSFCRNILGGVFPLVTVMLFTNLGEKAAGGLLGAIATVLTAVPWALVLFGDKIRGRSKYAVALQKSN